MKMREEGGGKWLLPAVAVTLLAAVVVAFWGPVQRLILEPLAWLLWAGWSLIASVDQEIWWVLLALACAVPVIRLFDAQLRLQDLGHLGDAAEPDPGGRVDHWINRAAAMRRRDDGRAALRADLVAMAASVAETTRTPLPREWDRDPRLAGQVSPRSAATDRAGTALLGWLPGFRRRADERNIERLLDWMEAALEIRDDRHSRSDHDN